MRLHHHCVADDGARSNDESLFERRADAVGGSSFPGFSEIWVLIPRNNAITNKQKRVTMKVLAIAALFSLVITCSASIAFDSRPVFAIRG